MGKRKGKVGANARMDGESEFRVAAALGDRSTAMAEIYGRDASRQKAQVSVLEGVQTRFADAPLETILETRKKSSEEIKLSA